MIKDEGYLNLAVTKADLIAEDIYLVEFQSPNGSALPQFSAGSHIDVLLTSGLERKYSLSNNPTERHRYVIAVKRDNAGRGGSVEFINTAKLGAKFLVSEPQNDFPLPRNANHFIFIAGGIGITPIRAMIHQLRGTEGKHFRLHYCSRSPAATAFFNELSSSEFTDVVHFHFDNGDPTRSLDIRPIVSERKNREHLFCCGPHGLMRAVREATAHWSPTAVHFEAFTPPARFLLGDRPFRVRLAKTGAEIQVPVGVSILEALRSAGYDVVSSCDSGTCGTCRMKLLEGEGDHRDLYLSEHDQASNIMLCVSRAKSDLIVIDR